MIEKGLTMRPRRDTFALGYIASAVAELVDVDTHDLSVSPRELDWMRSVLREYFVATHESTSPIVATARQEFESYLSTREAPLDSGPHQHSFDGTPPVSIDSLLSLTKGRRSVRWFDGRRVPRDLVENALHVAIEAPTACNRQPYRFEVFDDPAQVAAVAGIPMGTRGYSSQIPGIIVVIGDLSAFFDERDRHVIYIDGSLASMSLILGLEAQGVGSCCINWPDLPEKEAEMRSLLGLQSFERVIMLIAYGYPDLDGLVPFSAKAEIGEFASYNSAQGLIGS
jgi:nitroreductase